MAYTLYRSTAATAVPARRGRLVAASGVLAAGLALAGALVLLLDTGTPMPAILRYGGYLLLAVLLPGVLVHRVLRGRQTWLVADLALGAATGLGLELLAWALFTAAHQQRHLWGWPLLVVVAMLAFPAGRRELRGLLRRHPAAQRSPGTNWALAASFVLLGTTIGWLAFRSAVLPPQPNAYYQDLYWQLSIAAELTRTLPPEVPQVAGRTLHYHWFANAHLAASAQVSGVELPVVLLRLWLLPVLAITVGLLAALTRRVSGASWPGALAALLVTAPAMLNLWSGFRPMITNAFSASSPSQVFGVVFLLLAADVLVDLVRGRRLAGGWLVLALALAAGSGSKSSVLPVLLGGTLCALVAGLLRREQVRRTAGAVALVVITLAASGRTVAGGSAGATGRILGLLAFLPWWRQYAPSDALAGTGPLLVPGLQRGTLAFAALLTLCLLAQYVWVLPGAAVLRRDTRSDPAVWLLAGGLLAGLVAMLGIDHPSASQLYFARTAAPLGAVLAGWGFGVAVGRARRGPAGGRGVPGLLLAGAALGIGAAWLAHRQAPRPRTAADLPMALGQPLLVLGCAALVGAAGWLLLARVPRFGLARGGTATLAAAVLAGSVLSGAEPALRSVRTALDSPPGRVGPQVTASETEAARWLRRYAGPADVIATNVHCLPTPAVLDCDARAFWVSALTEHRVLVEGWGYTDQAQAAHGRYGRSYRHQPFDDPALLSLNDGVFTAPAPDTLARLRAEHGVRWLFADRRAGPISPLLARSARLRLSTADVDVFQL